MFWRTVSHGKTPYSWKITPRSGPGAATGRPSSSTRPVVGWTKPPTMFIRVVLPQPDGPMIETNSPLRMSNETSSSTRIGPARWGTRPTRCRRGCASARPLRVEVRLFWQRNPVHAMPVLPGHQAAGRGAQREVHRQRDEADADDADVDDVELEEGRCVLDQRAQPLLRGDQLGCHQRGPGHAERHAHRSEDVRDRQRHDHLAEDLEVVGAERARDAHVDRADLRDAFVHHDHAGEERGVEQDHRLGRPRRCRSRR